jgi:hypothetical protein
MSMCCIVTICKQLMIYGFNFILQLPMTSTSDVVLSSIARKLREVERLITVHNCFSHARTLLEDCKSNLERIRNLITPHVFNGVNIPIDQLLHICSSSGATNTPTATDTSFSPAVNRSG